MNDDLTCVDRTAKIGFLSSKVAPFLHTECQAAILASIVVDLLVFLWKASRFVFDFNCEL